MRGQRSQHIIGDGPLASNCTKALVGRGLHATAVRLNVGDGSDNEAWDTPVSMKPVQALCDGDAYNAFAILATKELNPNVRTVAAVSNAANSCRHAKLSLAALGSELLAMPLSGGRRSRPMPWSVNC